MAEDDHDPRGDGNDPSEPGFAGASALLASRVPPAAVAVLVTLSFLSFVITMMGPLMKWRTG